MNTKRALFCLFRVCSQLFVEHKVFIETNGYTLIHSHSFPNDEPPYIMVTYWGLGTVNFYPEDGESASYYLIKREQAEIYCNLRNAWQKEYEGWYYEGLMLRAYEGSTHSAREHAEHGMQDERKPKTKIFFELPNKINELCFLIK